MTQTAQTKMVTPPVLAKRWGVKPAKVVAFIRSGELNAIDITVNPGTGRPRFRISEADIIAFEERRAFQPKPKPQRRKRRTTDVPEYF